MQKHPSRNFFAENLSDWSFAHEAAPEECGFTSLRELLAPLNLCDEKMLTDEGLQQYLTRLEGELAAQGVHVDFLQKLPPRLAYRGLLRIQDAPVEIPAPDRPAVKVSGCDGACESCFQLEYCSVAKLVLGRDWPAAVRQGHINPSWSAFFSSERG